MNWWKRASRPRTPKQLRQKCRSELNSLRNTRIRLRAETDPKKREELQRKIEGAQHGVDLWCRLAKPSLYRWNPVTEGKYRDGDTEYRVSDIISYAADLPVTMMNVDRLISQNGETGTKEGLFSEQVKNPSREFRIRTERANMNFPIIVSPEGWIIDGSHRLAKAKWEGRTEIAAKVVDVSVMDGGGDIDG
jgi:hypothetical protein